MIERKKQLSRLTNGLRCRCPGFSEMVRVRCKGIASVRYCYYTCRDAAGVETSYPVGEPGLCRCSLGTVKDTASERFFSDDEAVWGFVRCLEPVATVKAPERENSTMWQMLPVGLAVGALIWFAKRN